MSMSSLYENVHGGMKKEGGGGGGGGGGGRKEVESTRISLWPLLSTLRHPL